ncbi:dTDP-4-dehydrorhamnose reductase [uncultured Draconibacterium sp.]|uniref:dTDP-4-dehydrorhamnose reductase n=1 Tax=uncultured Draconibacterium sp. TaxID=1573823 RepID=UPI0025ED9F0B|nr:dTDP-4-dehydrorhamnose reductase [uncultured Draconibacterium sp.]
MKVLVTGAYGQLGNEIKLLAPKYPGVKLIFTDVDTLDITDEEAVEKSFRTNKFDCVINCAAYTAVDKAETAVETARKVNALAPQILAKISKAHNARMIQVSTDYVFAGDAHLPYSENDEVGPNGSYGKTKLEGEQLCMVENPESVIIRTAWLYSSFGNNFVKTMLRLGKEREELGVVYDQVGSPTFAADLAAAILAIVSNEKFVAGVYHYSNEGVASWYDFAKAIFELSEVACSVNPVLSENFPTPAKRPAYSVLNKSKIRDTYNLKIPYWRDSLKICIKQLEKK